MWNSDGNTSMMNASDKLTTHHTIQYTPFLACSWKLHRTCAAVELWKRNYCESLEPIESQICWYRIFLISHDYLNISSFSLMIHCCNEARPWRDRWSWKHRFRLKNSFLHSKRVLQSQGTDYRDRNLSNSRYLDIGFSWVLMFWGRFLGSHFVRDR